MTFILKKNTVKSGFFTFNRNFLEVFQLNKAKTKIILLVANIGLCAIFFNPNIYDPA